MQSAAVGDVGDQLGLLPYEKTAASEQVARLAHVPRVDVRHREHAAAKQSGDFGGVDSVVLRKGIDSSSQRSASQYQANMHSQPTTSPSRNGLTACRKAPGLACKSCSKTVLPW